MSNKEQSDYFETFKKSSDYETFKKSPVAYFCAEYALESAFPTYAGGLGILSGDYIREIAKQGFPLVAIGLRYHKGQSLLSADEISGSIKLEPVLDAEKKSVIVTLPIEHRTVYIKAWHFKEDNINLYLLDTNLEENAPEDRDITRCLYDENRDIRLKQEIVLGIGGFRLLANLGYHASVYHLNEGHSAFLAMELIRHEMEHQHVNFKEACEYAKKHILFTNHTLALAGQEQFAPEKVSAFIEPCAKDICLDNSEITNLGASENNPDTFSMTTFSFKLSSKANAVSELHYQNAKQVWPNQTMDVVTNGIFVDRWDNMSGVAEEDIWARHTQNKQSLLNLVKEKTGVVWSDTDLVLVWARRLVEYKQPLFLFQKIEKLIEISNNSKVPIRVVFSGPAIGDNNPFQKEIEKIILEKMPGSVVFISGYNIDLSKVLTSGADIWLNTPVIGAEACGTSGMKAALNGALSLSTRDGWISEVDPQDVGWVTANSSDNTEILDFIEDQIIPMYVAHLAHPEHSLWVKKMFSARKLILENFSTTRMLKDYIEKLYIPIMMQKHNHRVD